MALCLRPLAVLADDPGLILSSQPSVTPFPGRSDTLFWHLQTLCTLGTQRDKQAKHSYASHQKRKKAWVGRTEGIPENSGVVPLG